MSDLVVSFQSSVFSSQKNMINVILVILPLLFAGCEKQSSVRSYEEETIASPLQGQMRMESLKGMPEAAAPVSWNVPKGWIEEKGSGFRLISFKSMNAAAPIDASIVTFPGQAGGLAANVERWMQQIELPIPDDLNRFITEQPRLKTDTGLEVIFFDFSTLQAAADNAAQSMLAAILELPQEVIFIKLTGAKSAVIEHRAAFKELLHSLKSK